MKVYISGQEVTEPVDGLENIQITVRRQDGEDFIAYGFTGELTFYGGTAEMIVQKFYGTDSIEQFIDIEFEDECCGQRWKYIIRRDSIEFCDGGCSVNVTPVENNSNTDALNCIRSTLIHDNWNGFQNKKHPRFHYCVETRPSWRQDTAMILGILITWVLYALVAYVAIFRGILYIVDDLFMLINTLIIRPLNSVLCPVIKFKILGKKKRFNPWCWGEVGYLNRGEDIIFFEMQDYYDWIDRWEDNLIGCGFAIPAPLLRDYIQNVCDKCGISFRSSILNDPNSDYYNTCLIYQPIPKNIHHEGYDYTGGGAIGRKIGDYWFDKDAVPLYTLEMLLTNIKPIFNAEWDLTNGELVFERFDNLAGFGEVLINWEELDDEEKIELCYTYTDETAPAFLIMEYAKDGLDSIAHEAAQRWNDVVEWNDPPMPIQKGAKEVMPAFAPTRFRNDGIERDVLHDYRRVPLIADNINRWDDSIILSQGGIGAPRLVVWDGKNRATASVKRYYSVSNAVPNGKRYNMPYWFAQGQANGLYERFHKISDPRTSSYKGINVQLQLNMSCALMNKIDIGQQVITPKGTAVINDYTLDFSQRVITINAKM